MTKTITMWGNATGYGASSGTESFVLNGYLNTVLLSGANDTISLVAGGDDTIDLNWSGFSHSATDTIDLGQGLLDSITTGHDLYGATLSIGNGYGATDVSLVNHGGSTSLALGNAAASVNDWGLGVNDNITLNGDATNQVSFTSGMGADIAIGSAGDGLNQYNSAVSLSGVYDQLIGGDETFNVSGASGLARVDVGNANNVISLGGQQNEVTVGNGDNLIAFANTHNMLHAGTGNNTIVAGQGVNKFYFGAGGAGSTDRLQLTGEGNNIWGGDENFVVTAARGNTNMHAGDGNNTISVLHGSVSLGSGTDNTAENSVTFVRGSDHVALNGGLDQVTLQDSNAGYDHIVLNGTMLGTQLTEAGNFDNFLVKSDGNAAISETGGAQGFNLTIDGDATLGMGDLSVDGLAADLLAHITLIGLSSYHITVDNTQAGGLTLHFTHGSLDLIGLQSISNSLITVVPGH